MEALDLKSQRSSCNSHCKSYSFIKKKKVFLIPGRTGESMADSVKGFVGQCTVND